MKTKELIRQLMEQDPSGEEEVCVNNVDIHFVQREPACWDGHHQVLIRDESNPYYNVIGAEYRSDGIKINITPLSIHGVIYNDPDTPVAFIGDYTEDDHKAQVEEWRADARRIIEEVGGRKRKKKGKSS